MPSRKGPNDMLVDEFSPAYDVSEPVATGVVVPGRAIDNSLHEHRSWDAQMLIRSPLWKTVEILGWTTAYQLLHRTARVQRGQCVRARGPAGRRTSARPRIAGRRSGGIPEDVAEHRGDEGHSSGSIVTRSASDFPSETPLFASLQVILFVFEHLTINNAKDVATAELLLHEEGVGRPPSEASANGCQRLIPHRSTHQKNRSEATADSRHQPSHADLLCNLGTT
jgi:hypothetical protein